MTSTRARRGRSPRRLEERLQRESMRRAIAFIAAMAVATIAVLAIPELHWAVQDDRSMRLATALTLFVLVLSVQSAIFAGLTHVVMRRMDRRQLVTAARIARARQSSPRLRLMGLRSTTSSESLQMVLSACAMAAVLQLRPANLPLPALFALTVFAISTAWLSCAVGYAVDYAALDAHGDGFRLDGQVDPAGRAWPEYLYVAVLVQTSSAPADFAPLTREARRLLLAQSVLAHIMATVVVAVGASAIFAAL